MVASLSMDGTETVVREVFMMMRVGRGLEV